MDRLGRTFLKVRHRTKGHCLIVNLWWVGHHAESSITTSKRRESVEDVLIREYQLLSISSSTPRVIPTALPQCPPLFASQQSLNRWCSAWESSDSHRLATNRLLGNQLTRRTAPGAVIIFSLAAQHGLHSNTETRRMGASQQIPVARIHAKPDHALGEGCTWI